MIAKRLAVVISNKKGDCFQVFLSEEEENAILNLISQLHNGKIKAGKERLDLEIGEKRT